MDGALLNVLLQMIPPHGIILIKSSKGSDLNTKHRKILEAIFKNPIQTNIRWNDIEKLIIALNGELSEGSGSRIRIVLNGIRAVFHRPHPTRETDKGAVMSMRRFLENAGIKHDEI